MSLNRSLIAPTFHPPLEQALRQKLSRRNAAAGKLGELEPLAIRLGLMQNTLKPKLHSPQLVVFAADHGLVVDGIAPPETPPTSEQVQALITARTPLSVFAHIQGMGLTVVDCGLADPMPHHPLLLSRKIAHGTRNSRVGAAMSIDQAQAAIRAGMEISDVLPGNVLACAGLGVGSEAGAAMLLSCLANLSLQDMIHAPHTPLELLQHQYKVLHSVMERHKQVSEPVEALACVGGFEIAMMVGAMLVAAGKRHLIIVDGLPACAALLVASRIATPVTDYCVFARSHDRNGLNMALSMFKQGPIIELGLDSTDGTGASLAWPLLHSAAALLTEVAEGESPGPTLPGDL